LLQPNMNDIDLSETLFLFHDIISAKFRICDPRSCR